MYLTTKGRLPWSLELGTRGPAFGMPHLTQEPELQQERWEGKIFPRSSEDSSWPAWKDRLSDDNTFSIKILLNCPWKKQLLQIYLLHVHWKAMLPNTAVKSPNELYPLWAFQMLELFVVSQGFIVHSVVTEPLVDFSFPLCLFTNRSCWLSSYNVFPSSWSCGTGDVNSLGKLTCCFLRLLLMSSSSLVYPSGYQAEHNVTVFGMQSEHTFGNNTSIPPLPISCSHDSFSFL